MKKYNLAHTLQCLWRGQTIARVLMNVSLSEELLKGKVVDVGGGHRPNYFEYFQQESGGIVVEALDASMSGIDFEKDKLPHQDNSVDTIILCNMLEHVYNYQFLLSEIYRIMKPGSQMIGFVPFCVGYHPDPHDYFRYTDECLFKIFEESGFKDVKIKRIGRGPIIANFNTIVLSIPRFFRPLTYIAYAMFDVLFTWLRPKSVQRNPLGYMFTAYR